MVKVIRNRHRRFGFTLLECIVALFVLSIAVLGATELAGILTASSATLSSQTDALMLANQLMAEVQSATLAENDDACFQIGEWSAPVGGCSAIRTLGEFPRGSVPVYRVSYQVKNCDKCDDPYSDGRSSLHGREILISVEDLRLRGNRRMLRPLLLMTRKEYSVKAHPGVRG